MKKFLYLLITMVSASPLFGGQFSKGDVVTLMRAEPLYFNDAVNRTGTKGETFTVYSYSAASHKVYVIAKDEKGQPIALNINGDSLALSAALSQKSEQSPTATPAPSTHLKAASQIPDDNTDSTSRQLDGFLGIKWGTSIGEAKKTMLARDGATLDAKQSSDGSLIFPGGTFFDHEVEFITLDFVNGEFYEAVVFFKSDGADDVLFHDLLTALWKKYGRASSGNESSEEMWCFPYPTPNQTLIMYKRDKVVVSYSDKGRAEKAKKLHDEKLNTKDL